MRRILAAAVAGIALVAGPASAGPDPVEKVYELTGLDECMDCVPPFCNVAQCETTDNLLHDVWELIR
jgi:hypothetical protein